jgi:uncharacterized surface protein with fasciclin (FAS1) repeats
MGIIIFRKGVKISAIIFFAVYLFFACTKTTVKIPVVTTTSTIAAIVKNGSNLTLLDSILKKTGVILTLDSTGPYTLFAAPDAAFTAAGFTDSTIYKDSVSYLKRLMLYHIIGGSYTLAQLPQGVNMPFETASPGDFIYITTDSSGVYINGNLITQSNVTASNGYIHAIQNVLFPPNGSVLQTLQGLSVADTTLTVLVSALNYINSGGTNNLNALLSGGGVYSIFAPTNNAFRSYFGDTTTVSFANYTPDSLANLLSRHIVNGRVFSSDFIAGTGIPSLLAGDSINFSPYYANTLVQKDSTSTSIGIIATNILATNGVIHKIDTIIFP